MKILKLKNEIMEYAWGSDTAIQELLSRETSLTQKPWAELWMGAHPKAPSLAEYDGRDISLIDLIELFPEKILGKKTAEKFKNSLPCLFKVLAAEKPLSIQAHPGKEIAKQGFERENSLSIPLNAKNRNYKDRNHKPECICALTPFWAMCGFKIISDIISLVREFCPCSLENEIGKLSKQPDEKGLKIFFQSIIESKSKDRIIAEAAMQTEDWQAEKMTDGHFDTKALSNLTSENLEIENSKIAALWIKKLYDEYPADIGVISPLFLNLVRLEPGQALFLPAGRLHSYLQGTGIELMANSDNVLRCGLTPKHIDVDELMSVLDFTPESPRILKSEQINENESVYLTPTEEFLLSALDIDNQKKEDTFFKSRSVEILLCTEGSAIITTSNPEDEIQIQKGDSVLVPYDCREYGIRGKAVFYKASVPEVKK